MAVDLSVYDKQRTLADHMRLNEEEQFKRRILERKLQQDINGSDPAAVKIVNDMQLAARASQDPNLSPQERAQASHRYNLLNQVSKSFAIDRGMNAGVPDFYGAGQGSPQAPLDQGSLQDPTAEFADALNQKEAEGTLSPATGVIPSNTPMPLPTAGGGVAPIPGFDDILANRGAKVKGAETQAQKNVEFEMNPLIGVREKEALDNYSQQTTDNKVSPILQELSDLNKKTYDIPYAGATQGIARVVPGGQTQETSMDLMKQARIELAAPLAKQLGVNPTDKDFQASLDRIFDANASRASRQAQIEALSARIKARQTAGVSLYERGRQQFDNSKKGVVDYTEYFK